MHPSRGVPFPVRISTAEQSIKCVNRGLPEIKPIPCPTTKASSMAIGPGGNSAASVTPWSRYRRARCSPVHDRLRQGWPGRVAAQQAPNVADRDRMDSRWNGRAASRVRRCNKIDWLPVHSGRRSAQRTPGSRVRINDDAPAVLVSSADRPFKGIGRGLIALSSNDMAVSQVHLACRLARDSMTSEESRVGILSHLLGLRQDQRQL
jgi:hypothetical protein